MYPLHPGRNPKVSGFSTIASIAIAGLSINASCGNPGTEFASLLTSTCPICIPPIPGPAIVPTFHRSQSAAQVPIQLPSLAPCSAHSPPPSPHPRASSPCLPPSPRPPPFPPAASSALPSTTSDSSCDVACGKESSNPPDSSPRTPHFATAPLPPA